MTSISNILSVHHSEVLLPWVNTTPNKGKEEEEEEIIQLIYLILSLLQTTALALSGYLNGKYLNYK